MLTGRNLIFAVLLVLTIAVGAAGFIAYDNVTSPDDNAFALRVAAENIAIQLEQGCQYDTTSRSAALAGGSTWNVPAPVRPSNGAAVPQPIATSIAVRGSGTGTSVNVALTSTSGTASVSTPCRADAVPPGSTVPGH
jgi:hypothetical protein